jgi:hypothetical protein
VSAVDVVLRPGGLAEARPQEFVPKVVVKVQGLTATVEEPFEGRSDPRGLRENASSRRPALRHERPGGHGRGSSVNSVRVSAEIGVNLAPTRPAPEAAPLAER